jgi:hypothetical protein
MAVIALVQSTSISSGCVSVFCDNGMARANMGNATA